MILVVYKWKPADILQKGLPVEGFFVVLQS